MFSHPAWLSIDTQQFEKNLHAVRSRIGSSLFCLPVKADAYGHGLCPIAQIAEKTGIVDILGISCLQEAVYLRKCGIRLPILLFGALHEEQIDQLLDLKVELTVSSKYKASLIARHCIARKERCKVHIEVDTGMRRTGVRPESVAELASLIDSLGCFEIRGIYSHLATSDLPEDQEAIRQIDIFSKLIASFTNRGWIAHLANSGGVVHYPAAYFDMVRPGLLSYGYFPDGSSDPQGVIRPCLSLHAKISFFKVVEKGEGISYGHKYKTVERTRIATVPVGHGDGYRRCLSQEGVVLLRGKRVPIAGAICMDQFMIDVGQGEAYVGDEVVLLGKQGKEEISLWELSRLARSIPHEMLCGWSGRLPRVYFGI